MCNVYFFELCCQFRMCFIDYVELLFGDGCVKYFQLFRCELDIVGVVGCVENFVFQVQCSYGVFVLGQLCMWIRQWFDMVLLCMCWMVMLMLFSLKCLVMSGLSWMRLVLSSLVQWGMLICGMVLLLCELLMVFLKCSGSEQMLMLWLVCGIFIRIMCFCVLVSLQFILMMDGCLVLLMKMLMFCLFVRFSSVVWVLIWLVLIRCVVLICLVSVSWFLCRLIVMMGQVECSEVVWMMFRLMLLVLKIIIDLFKWMFVLFLVILKLVVIVYLNSVVMFMLLEGLICVI